MIKEVVKQWDCKKSQLEEWFKSTPQSNYYDYVDIVKAIFTYVIEGYDVDKITIVDDGDYQGTQLFIIPLKTYQPSADEYLITHTYYGSCSGCDTLQSICNYSDGLPNNEQVKEYMTLALHLVQKMKKIEE